jgi:hypothetical protein
MTNNVVKNIAETDLIDCFYCGLYVTPLLKGSVDEGGVGFGDVVEEDVFLWTSMGSDSGMYLTELSRYNETEELTIGEILYEQQQDIKTMQKVLKAINDRPAAFSVSLQPIQHIKDLLMLFSQLALSESGKAFFSGISEMFINFSSLQIDAMKPTDTAFIAGWKKFKDVTMTESAMTFMIDTPTISRVCTVIENGDQKLHVVSQKKIKQKELDVIEAKTSPSFDIKNILHQYLLTPIPKDGQNLELFPDFDR